MFNVTITYKTGKIENTLIKISEYSEALKQLAEERRIISIKITGVK